MTAIIDEESYLAHYGILRRSGRYPWGSGGNQNTRNKTFLQMVDDLRKEGLSDPEICTAFGIGRTDQNGNFRPSTGQLRAARTIAKNQQKQYQINQANHLKYTRQMSNVEAAKKMGIPESTFRTLIAPGAGDKSTALIETANMLKRNVDEKGFIDIGVGVEKYVSIGPEVANRIGIPETRLAAAVALLEEQGYKKITNIKVTQLGTGHETQMKVLAPPGTKWRDVQTNTEKIRQIADFTSDGGKTYTKWHEPIAIDPKRVAVKYKEDGGDKEDGVIYVRRGVEDVSLGKSGYAQVRIKVGEDRYLKGMAIYNDNMPPGVDLVFNTNKSNTGNKLDAMKKLNDDPDLPFGSVVRQLVDNPGAPNERLVSAMNLVNEEGAWNDWSRTVASQMLSKQSPALVREQLGKKLTQSQKDLDEIMALTNPTVKSKLLETYASETDSAAVHLKAVKMPGQASQVILPVNKMKPTEIYAPNYNDGDRVVLIRYPHAGRFEIPELVVNNRNPAAKKLIGNGKDAVGIHFTVAERLSGADFDGDTVLVIPNNSGKIKTAPALEQLKGFDPKVQYAPYDGMRTIGGGTWDAKRKEDVYPTGKKASGRLKGIEMGKVSNLITDMTLQQAPSEHVARAVKHSMVVIDAEKHGLDWKKSYADNGIQDLYSKYAQGPQGGAATLISRATSEKVVPDRKPRPASEGGPIDRETGRLVYVPTNKTKRDGSPVTTKVEKLALTDDAFDLVSTARTPIEVTYARHSNEMKALANQARLAQFNTPPLKYSSSAKQAYAKEVAELNRALAIAQMNAPRERQAQVTANALARQKIQANPNLEESTRKKIQYQELETARARFGVKKQRVEITPSQWAAIQAGAITDNKLRDILDNADLKQVRALATPRTQQTLMSNKVAEAQRLLANGATRAEVARRLGVSVTTLDRELSKV